MAKTNPCGDCYHDVFVPMTAVNAGMMLTVEGE